MATNATRAGERRPADSTVEELERDGADTTPEGPGQTLQGAPPIPTAVGASTRKKAREAAELRQQERSLAIANEGRGTAVVAATAQKSRTQQGPPSDRPGRNIPPPGLATPVAARRNAEDEDSDYSDDSPSDCEDEASESRESLGPLASD